MKGPPSKPLGLHPPCNNKVPSFKVEKKKLDDPFKTNIKSKIQD